MAGSTPPARPMDFQHLASLETTALVDKLLQEQMAASLRHVRILREALDAAAHEISAPGDPGPLLEAFTDRLTGAMAAEAERARQEAAAALHGLEAQLEAECSRSTQLASTLAEAQADASRLETELQEARERASSVEREAAARVAHAATEGEEHRAHIERLTVALAEAEREAAIRTADVQSARERAEAAERDAAAHASIAAAQRDEDRAHVEHLMASLAQAEATAARLSADIQAERQRAEAAERDAASLSADVQAERARADAADQDLAITIEAHGEVETALRQAQAEGRQAEHARAALETELTASRTAFDRLNLEAAELRDQVERQAGTIAGLEQRLAEALGAGVERDALSAELEARRARIESLEHSAAERDAHARALEIRLQDAAQAEAQLLEDLAARELALEREQTAARGTREQLDALVAQHETAAARVHALEAALALAVAAGSERDTLATSLRESAARIDALETELADVARAAREDREDLALRLASSLARAEGLEHAHAAEIELRAQLQTRLDEAAGREAGLRDDVARLGIDHATAEARGRDVDAMAALFDASARALTEMAGITSSADLMTDLIKRLSIQFSRVALFRVKGDRLAGEQQVGFDEALDVTTCVLPSSGESLPARALRSLLVESLTAGDALDTGLPFGGTPTAAVSLPIVLHGAPIAVVYADDADMPEAVRGPAIHESSLTFARLLVGHVVALLVRHTHELKTLAELRDYAGTLLQEVRAMYLADVESGKTGDVLRNRLKDNIDCASQLYAYRAAMEGTAAAALLDERIAEEAAADTAFARDVARVMAECESLILNL